MSFGPPISGFEHQFVVNLRSMRAEVSPAFSRLQACGSSRAE